MNEMEYTALDEKHVELLLCLAISHSSTLTVVASQFHSHSCVLVSGNPAIAMSFEDAEARIITHMNEDHADALRLYVRAFTEYAGKAPGDEEIRMLGLDAQGMTLQVPEAEGRVHIPFDPPLSDPSEAHDRLVALAQKARAALDA